MLKALRYEILRNVTSNCRLSLPLAEKPVRVATLLNEALFLEDQVMTHLRSVFLEDRTHDWEFSDASGEGRFRYYSRIAESADVLIVYEIDDKYTPPPAPPKFCTETGRPLTVPASTNATQ